MIGICGLCGCVVDPSHSPDDDDRCVTYSGLHPRSEVEWYEVKHTPAQPPDAWWCEELCGKAICQDIGACHKTSPMAAEKWRKEADRIMEQRTKPRDPVGDLGSSGYVRVTPTTQGEQR